MDGERPGILSTFFYSFSVFSLFVDSPRCPGEFPTEICKSNGELLGP